MNAHSSPSFSESFLYWSLVRTLQYLTFTRPYIKYTIQLFFLFMHDPPWYSYECSETYYALFTGNFRLWPASVSVLHYYYHGIYWCWLEQMLDTWRSTSWYSIYLGDNLISWLAKRHATLSRLSVEAEYRRVSMLYRNFDGFATCYFNSIGRFRKRLLFIAIIWVRFIWPITQSNINVRNILRWIFILFQKMWKIRAVFESYTFHLVFKSFILS